MAYKGTISKDSRYQLKTSTKDIMSFVYRVFCPPAACEPVSLKNPPTCIFAKKEEALDFCIYIGELYGVTPLIDEYPMTSNDTWTTTPKWNNDILFQYILQF